MHLLMFRIEDKFMIDDAADEDEIFIRMKLEWKEMETKPELDIISINSVHIRWIRCM